MAEALHLAVPDRLERQVERILRRACARDQTLVTAESCTGGLVATLLTDVPGLSHAFDRGFVTYAAHAKHDMLGVPKALLEDPGPVSAEVARAMAEGALARSHGAFAVAVTGFAEDNAERGEEGGLAHFALARRDGDTLHTVQRFGDLGRGPFRVACTAECLTLFEQVLGVD